MIKGAIYDMDGLMVDSEPLGVESSRRVLEHYGHNLEDIPSEMFSGFIGRRIIDIYKDIKEFFGIEDSLEDIIKLRDTNLFTFLDEKLEMKPGLIESLEFFRNKGIKTALASSGTKDYINKVLDKFSLHDFFDVVISGDDVLKGKPDPEPYTKTCEKLNLPPKDCIVLEDARYGVMSAKAAGCKCIGIPDTSSQRKQDLSEADIILGSLNEIDEELLDSLSNYSGRHNLL